MSTNFFVISVWVDDLRGNHIKKNVMFSWVGFLHCITEQYVKMSLPFGGFL